MSRTSCPQCLPSLSLSNCHRSLFDLCCCCFLHSHTHSKPWIAEKKFVGGPAASNDHFLVGLELTRRPVFFTQCCFPELSLALFFGRRTVRCLSVIDLFYCILSICRLMSVRCIEVYLVKNQDAEKGVLVASSSASCLVVSPESSWGYLHRTRGSFLVVPQGIRASCPVYAQRSTWWCTKSRKNTTMQGEPRCLCC
jgi:hypothetical protein